MSPLLVAVMPSAWVDESALKRFHPPPLFPLLPASSRWRGFVDSRHQSHRSSLTQNGPDCSRTGGTFAIKCKNALMTNHRFAVVGIQAKCSGTRRPSLSPFQGSLGRFGEHPRRRARRPLVVNSVGESGIITPPKCLQSTVLLALAAVPEGQILRHSG